jgi:hypothetical protein
MTVEELIEKLKNMNQKVEIMALSRGENDAVYTEEIVLCMDAERFYIVPTVDVDLVLFYYPNIEVVE